MRVLIVVTILLFTVTGCITVSVPQTPAVIVSPATAATDVQQGKCRPYVPPVHHSVPATPQVLEPPRKEDYVRYLERLTEELADHIDRLLDYIEEAQADEDKAVKNHMSECSGL